MMNSYSQRVYMTLFGALISWFGHSQATTDLQNTTFDICGTNLPQTELNLGDLVFSETGPTDLASGSYTFFIQAPSNFEIDAASIAIAGTDVTSATVSQDIGNASRLEIILTVAGQTSTDILTIENVNIQLIANQTTTDGALKYILDGNPSNSNGLSDNDTLETISFSSLTGGTGINQEVCAIADVQNITISNSNITQNRTFQWQIDQSGTWSPISNSNTEVLAIDANTFSNGISRYRRATTFTVNGETCTLTSTVATVTVNEIYPGTITEGANQSICVSEVPEQLSAAGDVAITPGGSATYQWYQNDSGTWDAISGATDNFYQPPSITETTSYRRRITNVFNGFSCFEETSPTTVIVNSPVLGGTATDQNICDLSELQLLTINNGENSGTYQWQKYNVDTWEDISGATQNTYNVNSNLSPGVSEFRRVTTVSGASCQGISTTATISFSDFQEGTISGVTTICHNEVPNALASDTNATGFGTISYQWEVFDGTLWSAISGENNAEYQPLALQESTLFRREDSILLNGSICSAYTNEIEITVLDEINGGDASADQTICEGETPSTISISNGTAAIAMITYQWQSATNGNFTNIAGETDASFTFANSLAVTTKYRRQTLITDNAKVCSEFSSESTVFVNVLSAGLIGTDQNVCAGESPSTLINLSSASAAGNITYTWEDSTDGGSNWNVLSGAVGATYTPGVLTATTLFRRLDTSTLNGKVCASYTNEIFIQVAGEIAGGDGSQNQTVCEDEIPGILTVENATPVGTGIKFQWFSSDDDVTYGIIAGETGESLSFSSGLSTSTYFKRNVSFTENGNTCEAFSTPTFVTLLSLSEGQIVDTQTVCGSAAIVPFTSIEDALSNGAIAYTWQISPDGNSWSDITNTDQATFAPTNANELETYYRRKAVATLNGTSCEVATLPVIVYVNKFDNVGSHNITFTSGGSGSTVVCNGGNPAAFDTNFTLISSGTLSYEWQSSSDNITFNSISGANNRTYDPPAVTADIYYRRITTTTLNGIFCTVTSNVLELINGGNASPGSIGTTNPNGSNGNREEVICEGDNPSLIEEIAPATGQTLSYQWLANGAVISGATGTSYDPPGGVIQTTTYVRRTFSTDISGVTCIVNSNAVVVLVPNADDIGDDITICSNTIPPTLGDEETIEGASSLSFQWYDSDDGSTFVAIAGATGPTYTPNTALTTNTFYRRGFVTTVDAVVCGPEENSNILEVIINDVSGGTILGEQQICYGENPGLLDNSVEGSAAGVLTYQWFSSENTTTWNSIDDAVNNSYDPEAGDFLTTYYKRTTYSTLNGVVCSEDSNTTTVAVADEILPGVLANDQTICDGDTPATLTVTGGSTFGDQTYTWFSSTDGVIWNDTGVATASYGPPIPTVTTLYKRTISRTSFGSLDCEVETNFITITLNSVKGGKITDDQSVCEGSQPNAIVENESATGIGVLTYQWWSSPDNQVYTIVPGAIEINYIPPTTLTTSTYFKRVVTSGINGIDCTAETDPRLVTVIPYPIINNDAIIANDITNVSCFGDADGSIVVLNERITGGNTAQKQINTISLFGTPELNNTYSIIINGIVYEHQVTLNGSNLPQTNEEIAIALAQIINTSSGANTSEIIATTNSDLLVLTAKISGVPFTSFASTDNTNNAGASNVITQENVVGNTYEWTKIGDNSFTASTLSITDLESGVYQLTVYNEFCGITSSPLLVSEPDLLTLAIGDTCDTAITANSTGGIAPFTFTLTRPNGTTLVQTTNNSNVTYTGLTGGATYTVSVQGSSCPRPETETVTLPSGLQFNEASVIVENISCFEQNDGKITLNNSATTVTGGFPPYNFNWSGPDNTTYNTNNIANLAPGVYVLSVTDQVGCSATFTANVASKSELRFTSVQVVNDQLQCAGATNAEIGIQITADPSSQIQINWLKNGTSFATNVTNLSDLGEGTYEVIVTDTNSDPAAPCAISRTFEITAPEIFSATSVGTNEVSCFDSNGERSFNVTVQGGTMPYRYIVDNSTPVPFNTAGILISGLSNNSHEIRVTDANECAVQTFNLLRLEPISYAGPRSFTIDVCETEIAFSLNPTLVSGGNPFTDSDDNPYYLYEWRGPDNFIAQDITSFNAAPGTYFLTIIDGEDCASEELEFDFSPTYEPIVVAKNLSLVSCRGSADGAISVTISGGNRPYAVLWEKEEAGTENDPAPTYVNIGQNITQLNGLEEGRYRLTVNSNISSCTQTTSASYYQEIITLTKEESLRLTDGPFLDEALCSGSPGSISVSIFNSQGGDLSFYYDNALVPAVANGADSYIVQIADPLANASFNVVNDEGCGFAMPLTTDIIDPAFDYTSEEFEVTELLLVNEAIRFNNISEAGYVRASWNFGDGSPTVEVESDEGTGSVHTFEFPGVFDITLTVFNQQGCSREITRTVQIGNGYDVMFPTAFSPNGDGINDYFQGELTGIASFTFEVYDMWGGLIYNVSYDINELPDNWGWTGSYGTGKPYDNVSFRYLFVGRTKDNQQINRTGEATIIR